MRKAYDWKETAIQNPARSPFHSRRLTDFLSEDSTVVSVLLIPYGKQAGGDVESWNIELS